MEPQKKQDDGMSEEQRKRILERIKKLLRVAGDGAASEAEVESYAAMARKLMEEHNITEHETLTESVDAQKTAYESIREEEALTMARLVEMHDKRCAMVASEVCDCKVLFRKQGAVESIVFYGLAVDLAVCKAFFAELRASMKLLATKRFGSRWSTPHREYCAGFVSALLIRVRSMRQPSTTTAIVLCKGAMLDKWASERYKFTNSTSKSRKDPSRSDAFWAGRRDGQAFDLGVDRRMEGGR